MIKIELCPEQCDYLADLLLSKGNIDGSRDAHCLYLYLLDKLQEYEDLVYSDEQL